MKKFNVTVNRDDGASILVKNVEARDKEHAKTRVWLTNPGVPDGWTRIGYIPLITYVIKEAA